MRSYLEKMKASRVLLLVLVCSFLLVSFSTSLLAQTDSDTDTPADSIPAIAAPAQVTDLKAFDTDNDHGHSITIEWTLSADDGAGAKSVISYRILKSESPDGPFDSVGLEPLGANSHENSSAIDRNSEGYFSDNTDYYYRVEAMTTDADIFSTSEIVGPVQSSGQWFNSGLITVLIAILIFTILTMIFVQLAKKGMNLYVRPLAGIEAVDEAIGRATEMGRPILYVLGLGSAADIATIASFTILGRVAKKVAEYQTELNVPCYDPIVMAVAQEVVKSAFIDAGRPEAYKDDIVHFITNSQFAYVGAVNGIIMRDLPATNVYMGKFFAESLILAETGAVAGSIQIAGTDEIPQIPFFFVACDYTLIGEELFAASAYLGREPELLGSLKAQDYAKAVLLASAIIGILLINIFPEYGETFKSWFEVID